MNHTKNPVEKNNTESLSVAVLGASDRPDRYAFKAIQMLLAHGHTVHPVTPRNISLPGLTRFNSIKDVPQPLHTVTLYVNPTTLELLADDVIEAKPKRVIFNPGTEHPEIAKRFRDAAIEVSETCTLVLLNTGQFVD